MTHQPSPATPARSSVAQPHDFAAAVRRAEAEFREMPGLLLTEPQAARLWAVDERLCRAILAHLVEQRFLVRTRDEAFARA